MCIPQYQHNPEVSINHISRDYTATVIGTQLLCNVTNILQHWVQIYQIENITTLNSISQKHLKKKILVITTDNFTIIKSAYFPNKQLELHSKSFETTSKRNKAYQSQRLSKLGYPKPGSAFLRFFFFFNSSG